jgi:hypothetical protein
MEVSGRLTSCPGADPWLAASCLLIGYRGAPTKSYMCLIVCLCFFTKLIFIRFTPSYFISDPQKVVQYSTPSKGWFCPPFCPHLRGHGRLDLNPRGNDFWFTLLVGYFHHGPTYKFVSIWWGHVFVCHLSIGSACRGRVSACKAIS